MDHAIAKRKIYRRAFTICSKNLEEVINKDDRSLVAALLEKLSVHHDQLIDIDNTIFSLWLDDEDRVDEEMEADLDTAEEYNKRWYILKQKANEILKPVSPVSSVKDPTIKNNDDDGSNSSGKYRRHFKLPNFELPTFDGHVKNWIGFWAQFQKIHDDNDLSDDDKIHYLLQSMEKGSKAREMIESFPPCGKNYEKALGQLKQRFAKEEFIIDFYVRELIQLIISKSVKKLSTGVLYDKIMTQILALESLGLTQDKYASFLYPLVESALPEDIIKAWNRSHFNLEKQDKPLSKLLEFLRLEVESEERIHAAHFNSPHTSSTHYGPSTASCLTTSVENVDKKDDKALEKKEICIWCAKSFHTSSECTVAMKMNLDQRKEFLKQNRACLICLKKGHIARTCRKYPKCVVCGRRHYTLMCTDWPFSSTPVDEFTTVERLVTSQCLSVQDADRFSNRLLYFSNYNKIVRTVGWCLRFIANCRKLKGTHGDISTEEFKHAEQRLYKIIQSECFTDVDHVRKNFKLDTFRCEDGILRVKTRLSLSDDTRDFITPVLLPSKHDIVERLVNQKHKEFLHAGPQTLLSKLRESVWIVGGRYLTKRVVRNCVVCKRFSAKSCCGPVPPLPADRIHCGAPFQVSGVDFAGPLYLRSGEKCWIALFTCAVYRAVHLELCLSLSTEEFMLALRRFVARRGNVEIIYSDNGTNFRGASNILSSIDWDSVVKKAKKLIWRFSPPSAPWWGGFWERMVRSVKTILRRVLGKASLNFNELVTVLCEVEQVINSRPLTVTDNEELQTLTPASFLLQFRSPDCNVMDIGLIDGRILSSRWRYVTKLCAELKSRFRSEYLGLIKQKPPSSRQPVIVKPGDVVLVEVDKKRVEWPIGVVQGIMTGADGFTRVARIKTPNGEVVRAIQRLYPLELQSCDIPQGNTTRFSRSVPDG